MSKTGSGVTEEGLRGPRPVTEYSVRRLQKVEALDARNQAQRVGTSAVKGAPNVAKRNSLTQKSQEQLWKRTRGLTRTQTACVFTTLDTTYTFTGRLP